MRKAKKLEIKPGLYTDMSHTTYNNLPMEIVRNSYLNDLDYVPAMARTKVYKDTKSLFLGRAAHSLVLEGKEAFDKEFAVAPSCDRRNKAGKKAWADFATDNLTKTIVSTDDWVKIYGMDKAVRSHPFAKQLLAEGLSEQTVIWEDEETGILCRCRPDRMPKGHNILVDFKGCKDASAYGFDKSIATYRYYRQAAMYLEGISIITGQKYDQFVLIGCEWEFPHRVDVCTISEAYLDWGRKEFHELLRLEAQCRKNGHYPHYKNAGARDCEMPSYIGY